MLQPREFYKEELSGFFFLMGCLMGRKQPHPRPLSEWRGE